MCLGNFPSWKRFAKKSCYSQKLRFLRNVEDNTVKVRDFTQSMSAIHLQCRKPDNMILLTQQTYWPIYLSGSGNCDCMEWFPAQIFLWFLKHFENKEPQICKIIKQNWNIKIFHSGLVCFFKGYFLKLEIADAFSII